MEIITGCRLFPKWAEVWFISFCYDQAHICASQGHDYRAAYRSVMRNQLIGTFKDQLNKLRFCGLFI